LTYILAHHGLFGGHPENSLQAFSSAIEEGLDGFDLCVQPTADAVCVVMHESDLGRTTLGGGVLREMKYDELPRLKNGDPVPRLSDALDIDAMIVNVEMMGESGWKSALAAVEAHGSMGRVIFSSLEHGEVLQLWAACPRARCGLIWEAGEANIVTEEEIAGLPEPMLLYVPSISIDKRADFWAKYAKRLVVWGLAHYEDAISLAFEPIVCIVG
jgi:glycerophosphoryl diester phosphodiesterase